MAERVPVDKAVAIEAVREASWAEQVTTCGHRGCEEHQGDGQRMIHCVSGFGCDVSLDQAIAEIEAASQVVWADHWLHHDLAVVTAEGRVHCYDVRRPDAS